MIWLIGAKGMLASEINTLLTQNSIQWIGTDIEVDITDKNALEEFYEEAFQNKKCEWIINCAAYTAVDKAEDNSSMAQKLNADSLINIAELVKRVGAKLIHFSTDYVFAGNSTVPYIEADKTDPQSIYGKTKLEGELNIINNLHEHYIIRTAWLYGKAGPNFVSTMLRLMNEKDEIKVVNDQIGTPTYAVDLAKAVIKIITSDNKKYGIYHYSNEGTISWYDFACEIYKQGKELDLIKNDCRVLPCDSSQFHQKAKRPSFSLLNKEKIKQTFDLLIPDWKESLSCYLKELI
ncbi:dTDP-4-dehydrorhamnose reductase [Treponema sp. OMZ 787]|uniref:dTDP-4-dehydrorhamnose reductase n=1 Tax=Treponema sp. OMZ 787 TaxID=2563669 RepID=UPI0020A3E8E4|nr:dTDP-4-dehydrorhamnose reductase [Treponema sp. OMZ 787]UTC61594.1 dTDP-4-dehydrorhamnose reductase [Treponema sp. OMZ 787]